MALTVAPSNLTLSADLSGGLEAFDRWAIARGLRGKDIFDTAAKVMRYWVSFALAKVPRGDAARIHAGLMQTARNYVAATRQSRTRSKAKVSNTYRGTVAAAIVAALDYKGARTARGAGFYRIVGQFDRARQFSANHHRAGFLPAFSVLPAGGAQPVDSRGPRYASPAGSIEHHLTDDLASILVENFASQSGDHPFRTRPAGIAGLAEHAFDDALQEVFAMIAGFLRRDMEKAAASAGFTVQ